MSISHSASALGIGFLCDPKRCRLFDSWLPLILCASHFSCESFSQSHCLSHSSHWKACVQVEKQSGEWRSCQFSLLNGVLCHRKGGPKQVKGCRWRFVQFWSHFSSPLCGMLTINWLCLCFYLATNKGSKSVRIVKARSTLIGRVNFADFVGKILFRPRALSSFPRIVMSRRCSVSHKSWSNFRCDS